MVLMIRGRFIVVRARGGVEQVGGRKEGSKRVLVSPQAYGD